jgi:hypothetical protein
MAIRYYPSFRVKTNLITNGTQFKLNGVPYSGKYYETFDGKYFSGPNPVLGPNKRLTPIKNYFNNDGLESTGLVGEARKEFAIKTKVQVDLQKSLEPTTYHPSPLESDYRRGYFYRFFVKRINEKGYVKEISEEEFVKIQQGTVAYDVSYYQIESIMWKLTGLLNTVRLSQYDIRAGIVDTNKRLVETVDSRFLGLKAFIGENYSKFARPTQPPNI